AAPPTATAPPTPPTTPPIQKTSTSHRTPSGGGLSTSAMTCSGRELDCSARTAHNVARTATASRTPSDPRRRRWPSPSGAKTTQRQSRTARLAPATGSPATHRLLTATAGGESVALHACRVAHLVVRREAAGSACGGRHSPGPRYLLGC